LDRPEAIGARLDVHVGVHHPTGDALSDCTARTPRRATTIDRGAKLIALLGSVCPTIVLMVVYANTANISISGEEQNVIFSIQNMLGGEALYRDPSQFPFVVTQYTPIYYDLCVSICRWLGLQPDNLRGIYLVGRLISTAATLGSSLVMVAILARYSGLDRVTRFTLAFLLPLAIGPWACVARPDPLYLLLVVASLWAAMRYAETLRLPMLVTASMLLLAAFYTKQTALFLFPLPLVVRFARQGWSGLKAQDALVCLVVYGAGAVFMTPAMLRNFAVGLGNGIDLSYAFREVYKPIFLYRMPLLLAAGLAYRDAARGADWPPRAIGLATLWYLLVGASLAVKYGSSLNYLDEFMVGCMLIAGMARCLAQPSGGSRQRGLAVLLLGLLVAAEAVSIYGNRPNLWSAMRSRQEFYTGGHALAADAALRDRFIMVLDTSAMVFIPERAAFVPVEVLGSSAVSGHFELAPVTQAVRDGRLCFAVAAPGLLARLLSTAASGDDITWASEIGRTLLADFHPVRTVGAWVLLASDACRARSQ
jgi:hypothetical protein